VVSARHPALAVETFKFSTDPKLVATVTDIIGLYLDPRAPRGADDFESR
jgi:hypothetical protein